MHVPRTKPVSLQPISLPSDSLDRRLDPLSHASSVGSSQFFNVTLNCWDSEEPGDEAEPYCSVLVASMTLLLMIMCVPS